MTEKKRRHSSEPIRPGKLAQIRRMITGGHSDIVIASTMGIARSTSTSIRENKGRYYRGPSPEELALRALYWATFAGSTPAPKRARNFWR